MQQELDSTSGPADLDAVLADYMRRIDRGEPVDREALIAAHPALVAELRQYFSQAVAVDRFAAGDNIDTATFARDDSVRARAQLAVRCPSCHAPVELDVDTPLTDVTCSSCGSQFSLINERDASQLVPPLAMLGRFELISRLGMGGFGSVWKACDNELDRTVAIKIPRHGGMSPEEQKQFFREARAAAQLRHPNIVSVHEVGRDGDNVYIVSDLVPGVTLGDWFTGQQLTSREAAELCAKIADALHYAHEQGVVHRDLKPANIMIDRDGQPHIMDFGLARREVGEVTVTLEGHILGTPAYMSPEQARGESHKADRRSDVYSLGVILFQLLTGELPFRGDMRMLLKQVIQDDPPSPRKLNSNVPKDLETITLKCLEKEPVKRYETAREFSEELRRFLKGEPILARPVSSAERAVRWVRRNPVVAGTSAAAIAALVAGTVASTLFAVESRRQAAAAEAREAEAEEERASAQAVVNFLTDDLLAKASPEVMQNKEASDVLVKRLIEPAAATVGQRFKDKPLIDAAVQSILATTLSDLGRSDLALAHAEQALAQRRKVLGEDAPATITSLIECAGILESLGRLQEAEPLYYRALQQFRGLRGEGDPETITALNNYAGVLESLGRYQDAEPLYKQALEQRRITLGEDHTDTIISLNNYATVLESVGRAREATPLYEQALQRSRKVLGEDHPLTIAFLRNYASALETLGRAQEALAAKKETIDKCRKVLGEDHPDTIGSLNNYASALYSSGRTAEAELLFKQVLNQFRKVFGEDHPNTITSLNNYATVLDSLGRPQEAEPLFKQALEQVRKVLGEDHPDTISSLNNYAVVLRSLGRAHEAEPLHKQVLKQYREVLGPDHPDTIGSLHDYADVLESLGRTQEAEPLFRQALEQRRKVLGENHPDTIASLNNYAAVLQSLGRVDEGTEILDQILDQGSFAVGILLAKMIGFEAVNRAIEVAVARRDELTPEPHDAIVLGELRLLAEKLPSAESAIRSAIERDGTKPFFYKSLGRCLLAQGQIDGAREAFQETLKGLEQEGGGYDLAKADRDQLTAAYYLDLVTEQFYIDHFATDNKLAYFPWFYIAQRREIEGKKDEALNAYEQCVELSAGDNPHTVRALAEWRLRNLKESPQPAKNN